MPRKRVCRIKLTSEQTDKVIDICQRESERINEDFVRQLQIKQQEINELYHHKMALDAEISAIIYELQSAKEEKSSAKKSADNNKTTDNEGSERK